MHVPLHVQVKKLNTCTYHRPRIMAPIFFKQRSRAEAILDRARIQQTSRARAAGGGGQGFGGGGGAAGSGNSGADVLEKATRWGLQIWSLPKVLNW